MKGLVYRHVNNADAFYLIMRIKFGSVTCVNSKRLLFGIPCANSGSHRTRQFLKDQIKLI